MRLCVFNDFIKKFCQLSDLNHMMSMTDFVTNDVETSRIDSGCSLEKESIQLIHMNP